MKTAKRREMKKLVPLIILLLNVANGFSQSMAYPGWVRDSLKSKGLDKKYELSSYLNPPFLQADFNGDGSSDLVVLILEKATNKKGILLIPGNSNQYHVFGAGTNFGNGSDNFKWVDKWSIYKQKTAHETQFDKKSGDILGGKKIELKRFAISLVDIEDGSEVSGGLIYWDGKKYTWIHQGE
ncbi:MAG TPA: hypothetical protein VF939_15670 [Puia sp.]